MDNTYYIETYGCQMNEHDSEKIATLLESTGLHAVNSAESADVVVINTCSIREKAEHKVYSALGKLKRLKSKKPAMVTVLAGCVAQQEQDRLLKRVDHLDAVIGTHCITQLPRLLEQIRETGDRFAAVDFAEDVDSLHMPAPRKGKSPVASYVTIMQGCSNFCTYCVVPYTRGPEQSRSLHEIVHEVQDLVAHGVQEVTLLGQNVNAYGKDLNNGQLFPDLLRELDRIDRLRRIRFTTSHPRDFDEALVRAMADLDSVCEHIHLPLQSGSNAVLHAMNRGYTREEYVEKIGRLRGAVPPVAITADMIVGFPGETEEDFDQTLAALEEIRFDQIFSFKYSARPGTVAEKLNGHVPEEEKARRLAKVHEVQDRITLDYHAQAVGSVQEILVEGVRERTSQAYGRTRTNKIVNLEEPFGAQQGDLLSVEITKGLKHSMIGRPV